MKTHYVGIDIAKETLQWAVKGQETSGQVANSLKGMASLIKRLQKAKIDPTETWFCFEHTGNYGLVLCSFLESKGMSYTVLPALQIKQSLGITRGKSDKIDAQRIAQFAYTHREELQPSKLPGSAILKVKHLLSHRQQLVKMRSQEKNGLKALKPIDKLIDLTEIRQSKEAHVQLLDEQIHKIEQAIQLALEQDQSVKQNMSLLRSIKGIGLTIAAYLIVTTGNFTQFDNARKYNCYAGIAPFEYTSGTSLRGPSRVSNLGNKTIKALLYNGAYSAVKCDPELKAYYHRKLAQNKHKQSVINAVACKLIARSFAVVKRGTPYINTYQQKLF